MISSLDHLGVAVASLEEALPLYEKILGLELLGIEEVPEQQVRVAVLGLGTTRLELLEPTAEDSPVAKFLEKRGQGLHHLALRVEGDLQKTLGALADQGVRLIDRTPRSGAHGSAIAFLHPASTGSVLVELVAKPEKG
ncbi:MAG: methylmalonyl-CoA epimerase [Deltaproteobacteria bacterium RIFOXYA12_FULL_61_11]|nr:MAG: methylmalonyl-CoA epimerase [Deltaproteobacteria bacterium RIFOXYA12_FULL_61_11]